MSVNTSYVFGNDVIGGWGHRYFYTFYSEFGSRRNASYAEVAILSITFLLSVILNVSIACAVLRYREMRTVTNCFLLNLAAADLVFALGIPVVAVTRVTQEWILGDMTCRILPYTQVSANKGLQARSINTCNLLLSISDRPKSSNQNFPFHLSVYE